MFLSFENAKALWVTLIDKKSNLRTFWLSNQENKTLQVDCTHVELMPRMLVNQYTHVNQPASAAGVPLNQTYLPLTVLAPSTSNTTDFLFNNNMPIQNLAENRRQVELLAPSLASHFVSGYFPAGNYPSKFRKWIFLLFNVHTHFHLSYVRIYIAVWHLQTSRWIPCALTHAGSFRSLTKVRRRLYNWCNIQT